MDNTPVPLQELTDYENALKVLENPKINLSCADAFAILSARDKLHDILKDNTSQERVERVTLLDKCLKKNAYKILQVPDFREYRSSLCVPSERWWWNLETTGDPHPYNRFDWVFRGVRGLVWTVNLGLIATLATRLLSGGSGLVEILAIAVPSALALSQANNEFTAKGQEHYSQWLNKLPVKSHWHEEIKTIPPVILLSVLGTVWLCQPLIAEYFNQQGNKRENQGQLVAAEQNYLKAIAFDGQNLNANYNLGVFYEDLQDFDTARKYYLIAAKAGLPEAYNNLGRLYILQEKYGEAVMLLTEGQEVIDKLEQQAKNRPENLPEVKYSLYKNLGLAQLKLNNLGDAEDHLNIALGLVQSPEVNKYIPNPGAVYCLFAQLREQQKKPQEALKDWRQCKNLIQAKLSAGERINLEELEWLYDAKQKVK